MKLRLILGDQLNHQHSWFSQTDPNVTYLLAEVRSETDYVRHHVQKICLMFRAMEKFATWLKKQGHQVIHLTLDDTTEIGDFKELLQQQISKTGATSLEYQRADEYRLHHHLREMDVVVPVSEVDSEHFIVPFEQLGKMLPGDRNTRMETFYRKLRKQHDILMDGTEPAGGQWNYDASNRSKLKTGERDTVPEVYDFSEDVSDILDRLKRHDVATIGTPVDKLNWPTDRNGSLALLEYFCQSSLPSFGTYQDAMVDTVAEPMASAWVLFHSRLSAAINIKLLHPLEVIDAAIQAYQQRPEKISIEQVEGFVRQILGWREFIRGLYWTRMPEYGDLNYLGAERDLPAYFWTGETKMNCVSHAIRQSLDHAYAHHIQRLMVTGNLCLLAGIDPDQVDAWYLGIYVDAFEWVEMPNTRGMSQFADGGIVGSKAYAASGNYINKQSDYCKSCQYDVKQKTGANSCPLNSLYWHFMVRHRELMEKNPRIGMVYRNWDKQDPEARALVLDRAEECLANLNQL